MLSLFGRGSKCKALQTKSFQIEIFMQIGLMSLRFGHLRANLHVFSGF